MNKGILSGSPRENTPERIGNNKKEINKKNNELTIPRSIGFIIILLSLNK